MYVAGYGCIWLYVDAYGFNCVELCCKYVLTWLKEGSSPNVPHPAIAPFGTKPIRACMKEPPTWREAIADLTGDRLLVLQASSLA